jgi:SAM-dependent methyltransferase
VKRQTSFVKRQYALAKGLHRVEIVVDNCVAGQAFRQAFGWQFLIPWVCVPILFGGEKEDKEAMCDHRFKGKPARLRSNRRVKMLEVGRVVDLCLKSITIGDAAAASVLDVGTGSALFAEAFARRGSRVAGVDVNAEMVAAARQVVSQGDFRQAPAEELPFKDGTFDLVFMGLVLHELDDVVRGLAEARRVARQRVAVLEWPYRPQLAGPPMSRRLPGARVRTLAREAGLGAVDAIELANTVLYLLDVV